jgi:hypothetical protein
MFSALVWACKKDKANGLTLITGKLKGLRPNSINNIYNSMSIFAQQTHQLSLYRKAVF